MSFPAAGGPTGVATSVLCFAVGATLTRADVPALCADLAEALRGREPGVVVCDVAAVVDADLVVVEALARLRMTARRHGWWLTVSGAGTGLRELAGLLGLAGALFEPVGQAEEREQVVGVEEVVEPGDPAR